MPKFSIIIPVYNVEKYIKQCVESVLNQIFKDFEALFVDDCSSDESINILQEYALKDKRIKILRHKKNKGQGAARNTALKKASGKYIVCLDSDDWLETNCLSTLNDTFNRTKAQSVWFNAKKHFQDFNNTNEKIMYEQAEGWRIITPEHFFEYSDFSWIKAYTRESIQKYDIQWPEIKSFEDGEFYFKYYTYNPRTYVIQDCLINYRHRKNSITRKAERGYISMKDIYGVVKHLQEFWIEYGEYDKYKITLLSIILNRILMCHWFKYTKENKKLSLKFLKDLNFPEDFSDYIRQNHFPLVSVVIPVYNVEKYVKQCMESIINQTYTNLEIIVVDDKCEDNTMSIINEYKKRDKRIKVIKHKTNRGPGAARNTGLLNAKGEYIFFIDSDDWIESDCLETTVRKLIETNLNTVMYKADVYAENSGERKPIWYKHYVNHPEGYMNMQEEDMCNFPHYSWNAGYRRNFLIRNNIFWPEGLIYEDTEFFFKVFINSPETYLIDKPFYVYRERNGSLIKDCFKKTIKSNDLYIITKRIYDYLVENNYMYKYKQTFLHLVYNNMCMYKNFYIVHKRNRLNMLKCLDTIKYPEEYKS